MFIKEITLKNFLSYRFPLPVPLASLNVIIGANASGKSNLIEAIDILHNASGELLKPIRNGGGNYDKLHVECRKGWVDKALVRW